VQLLNNLYCTSSSLSASELQSITPYPIHFQDPPSDGFDIPCDIEVESTSTNDLESELVWLHLTVEQLNTAVEQLDAKAQKLCKQRDLRHVGDTLSVRNHHFDVQCDWKDTFLLSHMLT
jgi:hypothetical protein